MSTHNVKLTAELSRFVAAKVESGSYENASEVVRAALRMLHAQDEARTEWHKHLRGVSAQRFGALDRGEGVSTTVDDLLAGIDIELTASK